VSLEPAKLIYLVENDLCTPGTESVVKWDTARHTKARKAWPYGLVVLAFPSCG
jgi:hypothetical protein